MGTMDLVDKSLGNLVLFSSMHGDEISRLQFFYKILSTQMEVVT